MDLPTTEIPVLARGGVNTRLEVPEGAQPCVLIVDDNPGKLAALTAIISGMGLEAVTARTGRAALRLLLERDFSLVLLDVNMPVMDGYETAELIHGRPRSAQTPIIFVTAELTSEAECYRGYSIGAVDWIFSPIVPEILKAKVKVFVELYCLTRIARSQSEQLQQRAEEISHKNRQLEQSSRLKSEFLANMSHELRTPLNAVIGFAALLRDGILGQLNEKQIESVTHIHDAGHHLLSLINDILDLSKVEAGQMDLEPEPVAIGALLKSSLVIIKEHAVTRHIRINLELDKDLREVAVDVRKVTQIVFNLLSNAVKFTQEGGVVRLVARCVPRAEVRIAPSDGWAMRMVPLPDSDFEDFLEIKVYDTGIGIAEHDMQLLFNSFVQIDSSMRRQFEGTGLGLALVRQFATLHGGTVGVTSAPEKGSCFLVWLPWRAAVSQERDAETVPATVIDRRADSGNTPAPAPQKLPLSAASVESPPSVALVIEDDLNAANILRTHLESIGLKVIHAADAETGLAYALREPPALITLDLVMPCMDGWEVLDSIKSNPRLAPVPVVIVSVIADKMLGYALGTIGVLQKPIVCEELLRVVGSLGLGVSGHRKRKPCVLAVDDDPRSVEIVTKHLGSIGCKVVPAYGGSEAIETARKILPNLIILDLMMPAIDGFDVVEALKSRPDTAGVPILVLTAKDISDADRKRLNGYVVGIAQKSAFDCAGFLREVKRAMRGTDKSLHGCEGN